MLIILLFIIVPEWRQPQCPSTDKQINKMWWKWQSLSCVWFFIDPMDCSLPGPSGHGILQARKLEWVGIPFSRGIFPTQGSNPCLSALQSLPSEPPGKLKCGISIQWDIIQPWKKNKVLIHCTTWMNLESIMLSKRTDIKSHILWFHLCELSSKSTEIVEIDTWLTGATENGDDGSDY